MRPSGVCCAAGGGCCDGQHGQRLDLRHNRDTEKVVLGIIVVLGQRVTCVATVTTLSLSKLYGGVYKRVCEGVVEYCIGVLCMFYRIYENPRFLMLCCCGRGWGERGAGGCAEARCGASVRLPAAFPPAAGRLAMSSGGGGPRIAAVIISGASSAGHGTQGMGCMAWGAWRGLTGVWCVVRGAWCVDKRQACLVRGVWSTSNPSATHAASQRLRPRVRYPDTSVKPDDTDQVRHRFNQR